MICIKKATTAIAVLLISFNIAYTQEKFYPTYEAGINAGTFIYQGDLTPSYLGAYKSLRPAFGLYGSRTISPSFSVRLNFATGKMNANDADYSSPDWRQQRNFNFSTSIKELTALAVYNPLKNNGMREQRKFSTYFMAGAGFAFLNTARDWSKMTAVYADQNPQAVIGLGYDTTHALPKIIPVIPLGIGAKYIIGNHLSIHAEALYRVTFTDYIDGFSYATVPVKSTINKDRYYSLSIGISYTFNKDGISCPRIKR